MRFTQAIGEARIMARNSIRHTCLPVVSLLLAGSSGWAAEWQWSVPVEGVISQETQGHPRAFLWIPPACRRVRAVVVGQHNMQEEPILEHPRFRAALAELDFGEVWVTPPLDPWFRFDKGAGEQFDGMMAALARESGYGELARAPIAPIGHSAAASYPWNFAAWNPGRTLAALSISGQWPYWENPDQPKWGTRTIDGVPGIVTLGEYEWADERAAEGLKQRTAHPKAPMSMLSEPAAGHFDATDAKVEYLALYLKKAAHYRLPSKAAPDGSATLRPIDPTREGWLVERWRFNQPPATRAAPVNRYRGNRDQAFWFFDDEIARATERIQATFRGQQADLVGYVQNGNAQNGHVIPQVDGTHQQVTIPFLPIGDGLTFQLTGAFLDAVPKGRPERWTGLKAESAIGHGTGAILIDRICGPVEKLSADTFAIRFYRMGMDNRKRSNEIWLVATNSGDRRYKRAAEQAVLHFPLRNTEGADQRIDFPEIANRQRGTGSLKLQAKSSADAKVYFYVREGPAEVEGDTLRFTAIPPRSRFPLKVTVVAWQWGRGIEPKLKTADPVERSFWIEK